ELIGPLRLSSRPDTSICALKWASCQEERVTRTLPAACILSVALTTFAGCSANNAVTAPANTAAPKKGLVVAAPGLLEPLTEEFKIGSEISGRLRSVLVEEGDNVKRNQVVATMDDADYQARVHTAEAEVRQRESDLQRLIGGSRTEERQIAKYQMEEA